MCLPAPQNRSLSTATSAAEAMRLCQEAIRHESLPGAEAEVVALFKREMEALGWAPMCLPLTGERANLFVQFGEPTIVFTTHLDVVAAPPHLFTPRLEGDVLYGRGACDAKGIAATMMVVARVLLEAGHTGFGLLFVVGEEEDGAGAQAAAQQLQGKGIRFLINGEPTEGRVAQAHKGGLGFRVHVTGKACHSGYPEAGYDANREALGIANQLLGVDFGESAPLGKATLNLGRIDGGVGASIVSPHAVIEGLVRTIGPNRAVIDRLREVVGSATLEITYDVPCTKLLEVPGLPSSVVSYCCDIPFFAPLEAKAVLYGPGSILRAHTDEEYITRQEIEDAIQGYQHIFRYLSSSTV